MNAAETIAAAIENLEKLKADASAGEWSVLLDPGDRTHAPSWLIDADDVEMKFHSAEYRVGRNAELLVTLHRTIDAQLAILRDAAEEMKPGWAGMVLPEETFVLALDLARAILGVAS